MKKVCIMSHGLAANGIDTFVVNLAKNLNKEKYKVCLTLALDDNGHRQLREDEIISSGVPVYRTCDLGSIKRVLRHARQLYRILKEQSIDVFHSNMDLMNGLNCIVAWFAGVPIRVCHSHTSSSQYETKSGKHLAVNIYRFIMKTLCAVFSNRKCGCSDEAMKYLFGKNWKKKKYSQIISNGIDIHKFTCLKGTHNGMKRVITVGRLSEVKNPLFAINVILELSRMRDDFRYIWVGNGDLYDVIHNTIIEYNLHNQVELLGARKDVDMLLRDCDVFLLPSLFEGLPISLIEAQAAGLPCVISDTITTEIDCGGCIFLSLKSSAKEWAMTISDLLDGKRNVKIDKDQLDCFDINHMVNMIEDIYDG